MTTQPFKPKKTLRKVASSHKATAFAGAGEADERRALRPDGPAGSPRADIERAAATRVGSIQALIPPTAAPGVAGFVEPACEEDGESGLPPCLEEV